MGNTERKTGMSEWKEVKLGEICSYGKERIGVASLTSATYISTENMQPNRGGVVLASSIPDDGSVVAYKKGDVLVSNIRPYFKKIWRASHDGGCSADVLVFRNRENVDAKFLYYLLSADSFFDYSMATAKGTKMPRGDKNSLMEYGVKLPPLPEQRLIAKILGSLDDKIELNSAINRNLEEQARALFKNWFIDFAAFGGVMPGEWHKGTVADIIVTHDSKRIPLSGMQRDAMKKIYPYYGATSCMDYVDNYIFDGIYLLFGEDGTVIDEKGFPILQYVEGKFWVNNHAHILTGQNGYSVEMLYLFFSLTSVREIVTGAVQPKISQGRLNSLAAIIPDSNTAKEFDEIIQPIFAQIRTIRNENQDLILLRDAFLPKLMSGEQLAKRETAEQ